MATRSNLSDLFFHPDTPIDRHHLFDSWLVRGSIVVDRELPPPDHQWSSLSLDDERLVMFTSCGGLQQ